MRHRMIARVVATATLVLLFSAPAAYANTWQNVKKAGVLTVGIEGTYPPFDFMDENNQPTGFDVDLARAIGKELGVKVSFVSTKWTALIGGLNADKFDVIAADMNNTPERAKSVDFTIPYNVTGAVLICRKDNAKYHKLSDLKGAHVGAGVGTAFADLAKSVKGANVTLYSSMPAYLQDLMNGRLDVIINAKAVSAYAIKKNNYPLEICSDVLNKKNPGRISMAVKKGNKTLLAKLDHAIEKYTNSPAYQALYNKWFGAGTPTLTEWKQAHGKK